LNTPGQNPENSQTKTKADQIITIKKKKATRKKKKDYNRGQGKYKSRIRKEDWSIEGRKEKKS